ncbi:hypothetical protein [Lentilactobacillus kribbianus]|uniref:hypothetical protein n=1 Tax=Lentilactobacillus kribbianus TaxID=2729622 RepID=UPI0015542D72|nr:hypothetical protein [Lentilactobacillus kribbianus]
MGYLTFEEYQSLPIHDETVDETTFKKFIGKSSLVLDELTRNFYQLHALNDDPDTIRSGRFKQALALQISYFNELGTDSSLESSQQPQSISMGRTTISYQKDTTVTYSNSSPLQEMLAPEARSVLIGTGLLYRGL